jgi:hypothetical protein
MLRDLVIVPVYRKAAYHVEMDYDKRLPAQQGGEDERR